MRRGLSLAAVLLVAFTGLGASKSKVVTDDARLELKIASPEPGAIVGDPGGMAFLAGKALAHFGEFQTFDIMFVLDVSDSTGAPSGADIDGDGVIGRRRGGRIFGIFGELLQLASTDRGDNILSAEIAAVETLLDQLDPRTTRVGIVTFSGDPDPFTPDAETWVPLTSEYGKVRRGLQEIADQGPYGRTNMVSGVLLGTVELLGSQSAFSERREDSRRIIVFLTDGTPTLPLEGAPNQNARMAIQKAKSAAKHGVRIDTYAIGPEAINHPVVTVEMAHVTQGVFTPVRHPEDLVTVFEEVDFANIQELRIINKTTKKKAAYQVQNADGTFSALVPMREGINVVEVFARASDGTKATRRIKLKFLKDGGVQELDPRLLAQRNRLMENRLLDLRRRRMEIETERDEDMRQDLMVEIERERQAAKERAEEQRKALDIKTED